MQYSTTPIQGSHAQVRINEFIRSVYNWMAVGLALTGITAFYVGNNEAILNLIYGNQLIFIGLIIGELVLIFSLIARIQKIQA